jgi:hypothetical protein
VAAARVGSEIVGTLGFVPVRTRVHAREVIATQQVDVAILPEHRGGGLYFRLANAVMEEAARRGIAFGYGFATEETRALSVDFLGFDLVGPVRRLSKVLDYGHYASELLGRRTARMLRPVATRALGWASRRPRPLPRNVARIDRFDERVDRLAETLTLGRIMVIRDAAYLNWRYADCPMVKYGRRRNRRAPRRFVVLHLRGRWTSVACRRVGVLAGGSRDGEGPDLSRTRGPGQRRGGERDLLASTLAPARDPAEGARVQGARSPQLPDRRLEQNPGPRVREPRGR